MPGTNEFLGPHRQERHPVFVPLGLPRHPNDHDTAGFVTDWILNVAGVGGG